jgi:CRP-like cAMP-binding protein
MAMKTEHPQTGLTRNRILAALPDSTLARLAPHLEPVSLSLRELVFPPREPVRHALFPLDGVVSLVAELEDGNPVEIATIGNEGMTGLATFLKTDWLPYRAFVQVPGRAVRLDSEILAAESDRDEGLSDALKRHTQALLTQVAQSVACNRMHAVEARCARWLLMTHDRVGRAEQFPMTQEFLATMLGVRRATVTVAAGILQRAGFIRYTRGKITVVDRKGLEAASCECYAAVRAELDRLLPESRFDASRADQDLAAAS